MLGVDIDVLVYQYCEQKNHCEIILTFQNTRNLKIKQIDYSQMLKYTFNRKSQITLKEFIKGVVKYKIFSLDKTNIEQIKKNLKHLEIDMQQQHLVVGNSNMANDIWLTFKEREKVSSISIFKNTILSQIDCTNLIITKDTEKQKEVRNIEQIFDIELERQKKKYKLPPNELLNSKYPISDQIFDLINQQKAIFEGEVKKLTAQQQETGKAILNNVMKKILKEQWQKIKPRIKLYEETECLFYQNRVNARDFCQFFSKKLIIEEFESKQPIYKMTPLKQQLLSSHIEKQEEILKSLLSYQNFYNRLCKSFDKIKFLLTQQIVEKFISELLNISKNILNFDSYIIAKGLLQYYVNPDQFENLKKSTETVSNQAKIWVDKIQQITSYMGFRLLSEIEIKDIYLRANDRNIQYQVEKNYETKIITIATNDSRFKERKQFSTMAIQVLNSVINKEEKIIMLDFFRIFHLKLESPDFDIYNIYKQLTEIYLLEIVDQI